MCCICFIWNEEEAVVSCLTKPARMCIYYTPIAFDERVTFWLQRAGSLPCACVFCCIVCVCDCVMVIRKPTRK